MKARIISVDKCLFRSPYPQSEVDLAELKRLGITRIINLQHSYRKKKVIYYGREKEYETKYQIAVFYHPLHWFLAPSLADLETIAKYIDQHRQEKILVHCTYGVDRTGMAIAYYQITRKLKPASEAIADMLAHGFHRRYFFWWIRRLKKNLKR